MDAGRLQVAQQAALVVLAAAGVVHGDVLGVFLPQLVDGSLNVPDEGEPGGELKHLCRFSAGNITVEFLMILEFVKVFIQERKMHVCTKGPWQEAGLENEWMNVQDMRCLSYS